MKQHNDESRIDYLLRVLDVYMDQHGHHTISYDEADCDGVCLANDIRSEIDFASDQPSASDDFAKILVHNGKQVLVVIEEDDDENPSVQVTTTYDGVKVKITPSFDGPKAWDKAQRFFDEITQENIKSVASLWENLLSSQ